MFIERLKLKNFKGINEIDLEFDRNVNLIVGVNGVGKSSVLDALRILLTSLTSRIEGVHQKTRRFNNDYIKNEKDVLEAVICLRLPNKKIADWSITRYRKGSTSEIEQSSNHESLNDFVNPLRERLVREKVLGTYHTSVPIVVYYNVHRAYKSVDDGRSLSITKVNTTPLSAYENALEPTGTDFESLEKWFGYRYKWHKKSTNYESQAEDRQLMAVQSAIKSFLPYCTDMWFDEEGSNSLHIKKNSQDFKLSQMSDGEISLIALVADIARRLAIANPGDVLGSPLDGQGVILVDEIELHLHPGWQRKLVKQFKDTFPKCQFFFTTHSPQVIGHVEPKHIWLFKRMGDDVVAYRPEKSLGMDSNSILEQLLGVDEREPNTKQELEKLAEYIENDILAEARVLLAKLTAKCGDIDELRRAKAIIQRKTLLGLDD
ncbi:MAG: AAA family ATPase [Paraglaciecola polaris]|uniref:AAA family ATPase n=1 Tax=Paraglaciecola polaris TaxID=222814 RepID=UPI0030026AF8|tara:strand:+ start:9858 stop:11153 length:1296 start_codon:yes stop_codon:yes gene_type:complete